MTSKAWRVCTHNFYNPIERRACGKLPNWAWCSKFWAHSSSTSVASARSTIEFCTLQKNNVFGNLCSLCYSKIYFRELGLKSLGLKIETKARKAREFYPRHFCNHHFVISTADTADALLSSAQLGWAVLSKAEHCPSLRYHKMHLLEGPEYWHSATCQGKSEGKMVKKQNAGAKWDSNPWPMSRRPALLTYFQHFL